MSVNTAICRFAALTKASHSLPLCQTALKILCDASHLFRVYGTEINTAI